MKVIDDFDLYAKLLLSVNVHGKNRPLSPFECTTLMKRMLEKDGHTKEDLSIRLEIKEEMINLFLSLDKIPKEYQNIIIWGESNEGGVSFSSANKIIRLQEDADRKILLGASMSHKFSKKEIENIVGLKNKSDLTIEDCIEKVKNFRPEIEHHYMYIIELNDATYNKISEESSKEKIPIEKVLKNIVSHFIPNENILATSTKGKKILLSFDETGAEKLNESLTENKLVLSQLMEFLIKKDKVFNHDK